MAFARTITYWLTNYLPYTMTLTYSAASQGGNPGWDCWGERMPWPSLPPGGDMVFDLNTETSIIGVPVAGQGWAQAELHYDFTDVDGGQHRCQYFADPGGAGSSGNIMVYSLDMSDGNYVGSTATFYISTHVGPHGGQMYQAACVLTHPAEVTIDAAQDPAAATSVMGNLWPQAQASSQSFTPTSGLTFATGPWTRGSAIVNNASTQPVTLTMEGDDTKEETTSIGMELSWSASLDILGLVNQTLSASITGDEEWTTSLTQGQSFGVTIDPGQEGWLEWAVESAQITGDFTFDWSPPTPSGGVAPVGITYHVNNATVTEPGRGQNPEVPPITWRPQTQAIGQRKVIYGGVTPQPGWASPPRGLTDNPVVNIDAATDPAGAAQAMQLWPNATNQGFAATSNPIYTSTNPAPVSQAFQVPTTDPNIETTTFTVSQTNSSSWSLGGSVGAETTLSALGFANASVSVTFTASHQWSTSHTDTEYIGVQVPPGYESWIDGSTGQASFTGDYSFTAQGTDYRVSNVTITQPAPDPTTDGGGPMTAFTYLVVTKKLSPSLAATLTRPGWAAAPPHRPDTPPDPLGSLPSASLPSAVEERPPPGRGHRGRGHQ